MDDIQLIIFDCDGTLVDTEFVNNKAVSQALQNLGLEKYTLQYCMDNLIGLSHVHLIKILEEELGREVDAVALDHEIIKTCLELYKTDLKPVEGIKETLEKLNIPIAIASNGARNVVIEALEITGLMSFFKEKRIFTHEMVDFGKPSPDIYLLAAKTLGVKPQHCLVLEDSFNGVKAAKAAGMKVFGFTGASHNNESTLASLKNSNPDRIISNPQELCEI
jgi:HAD superfamily hydrolase (TIGR01509 family)